MGVGDQWVYILDHFYTQLDHFYILWVTKPSSRGLKLISTFVYPSGDSVGR